MLFCGAVPSSQDFVSCKLYNYTCKCIQLVIKNTYSESFLVCQIQLWFMGLKRHSSFLNHQLYINGLQKWTKKQTLSQVFLWIIIYLNNDVHSTTAKCSANFVANASSMETACEMNHLLSFNLKLDTYTLTVSNLNTSVQQTIKL